MDKPALRRLDNALTKGNLWLYVLAVLKRKKVHAYALGGEMEKRFGWKHGLITTYMVLYKLEAEGFIRSEFDERRKYYTITPDGRKALSTAKKALSGLAKKL